MEKYQARLCKSCGDRIRGRSDKVFCDDRCRNQFHNQERKRPALTEYARSIQHQLVKNRTILQRHLRERRCCLVDRDQLLRDGFSFDLFTHRGQEKNGTAVVCCYEFGYRNVGQNRIMIIQKGRPVGIFR